MTSQPNRRWQFGLRSLLVLIVLLSCLVCVYRHQIGKFIEQWSADSEPQAVQFEASYAGGFTTIRGFEFRER